MKCQNEKNHSDKYALPIKGARRVGKSTIVKEFVKSGNYKAHKSLDVFCDKFSFCIQDKYVVHTKDYKWESGINYIPVYMVPFL